LIQRGQLQLRGIIRWKVRRAKTRFKSGAKEMDSLPVVFGNAIPKNGSKLLYNILRGFTMLGPFTDTGLNPIKPYFKDQPTDVSWINWQLEMLRPGDIRFGYLYATPDNLSHLTRPGWANYLIIRDPRDAIVSEIYYAQDIHPGHLLHDHLASLPDMEARIDTLIAGIPDGELERVDVRRHYARFLEWMDSPTVCVVRFEDLITDRRTAIGEVLDHMETFGFKAGIPRDEAVSLLERQMAPEKSDTFRKGRTGEWRNHFTPQNKEGFKRICGDLLIKLGYEQNDAW
jgi:hypothetical protein